MVGAKLVTRGILELSRWARTVIFSGGASLDVTHSTSLRRPRKFCRRIPGLPFVAAFIQHAIPCAAWWRGG